jgi:hypothetical protein
MIDTLTKLRSVEYTLHFGDIFLADLRQYREEKLELMDLKVISALEHINYNLNSGIYQSRV